MLGYQAVLQKYLVGDNEVAYDLLPRMWMGKGLRQSLMNALAHHRTP